MGFSLYLWPAVASFLLVITSSLIRRHLRASHVVQAAKRLEHVLANSPEPSTLCRRIMSVLPHSVILPRDVAAFKQSMNSYWARQECEVLPACVVRPRDIHELSTVVNFLSKEYEERLKRDVQGKAEGVFAIRSGGHSPVAGAASIRGGVVIDLSLFCEVVPAEDGCSVVIGTGAKWRDVSKVLDEKGLAVVGGRNSAVGVGGLILGGGLSFFSPRFGLVCSNIISYEVVLADGTITTASESSNPDLWRALKGGSNNFGIVTRFTARSFPASKIWSGFLYMPPSQTNRVLAAFHQFVNRADSNDPSTTYDNHAAGPLACFSYVQDLGLQIISINLVYTKLLENEKQWPTCWKTSGFASLWRFWSTCKVRTLTSATHELNSLNKPGRRQVFATTTIKNDPATIAAVHATYRNAIADIRRVNPKGLVWTLVLQPLLPNWVRKGDANPLGLDDLADEPLVIVSFTNNWNDSRDDDFVKTTTRRAVEKMQAFAAAHDTGHRWRYLNYCAEWQEPFEGYGEDNLRFLREVSRRYDPDGLFQRGCVGGFKLGMDDDD